MSIDQEIAEVEKKLAQLKAKKEKEQWPKDHEIYVFCDKDVMWETGKQVGLSEEVIKNVYRYVACEVSFQGKLLDDGRFICHSVNKIPLQKPIEI